MFVKSQSLGINCKRVTRLMDEVIELFLSSLHFGSYGILTVILIGAWLLGFFLDWIEITSIVLALTGPDIGKLALSIEGLGVLDNPDLIWFTILIAICLQTSFPTPPVGFTIILSEGRVSSRGAAGGYLQGDHSLCHYSGPGPAHRHVLARAGHVVAFDSV